MLVQVSVADVVVWCLVLLYRRRFIGIALECLTPEEVKARA